MENNIPGTLSVLCNNPDVKQLIMSDMIAWGKQYGLKSFEQVDYYVVSFKRLRFNRYFSAGQGHLSSSGSILGAERVTHANFQEPTAPDQELLRTTTGRHVQTSGLNSIAIKFVFASVFVCLCECMQRMCANIIH